MTTAPQPPMQPAPAGKNGLALAGMILGIVSCALFCAWYISVPAAIVGIILSIMGKKKAAQTGVGAGMAKAGLILSVIGIALAILIVILAVVGLSLWGNKIQQMQVEQQRGTMLYLGSLVGLA